MQQYTTAFPKLVVMLVISVLLALLSNLGVFNGLQAAGLDFNLAISRPFQNMVQGLASTWHLLSNMQQIQLENSQLKDQVAQLSQELNQLRDIQTQNQFLLGQLNLHIPVASSHLLSPVVRYEYVPAPGFIYVLTGSDANIQEGDLAVRYNYIVGRVSKVLGAYAKVQLISANDSSIPVRIGSKGIAGRLVGRSGLDYQVINVDQVAAVSVGDEIKLLDIQGLEISDLIFGKVERVEGKEAEATKTLVVDNPVDLNKLDYVIIIPNHV